MPRTQCSSPDEDNQMDVRPRTLIRVVFAAMGLMALGCPSDDTTQLAGTSGTVETGGETEAPDPAGSSSSGLEGDSSGTQGDTEVTYYEHIRPLLAEHCEACHTAGSTAPFLLDTYQSVAAMAPAVAAVVENRTMPPFAVRADGSCGDWADPQWLDDEEIEAIVSWARGDLAAGEDVFAQPQAPELPPLDGRGTVEQVKLPRYDSATAQTTDDYRCFGVELGLEDTRFLTGYDVLPDNAEIVHHLLGYRIVPERGNNADVLVELEAQDEQPGWSCFGSAGDGLQANGVPVVWAPGGGAQNFPFETGIRFEAGDILVVQMHYNVFGDAGFDETAIDMQWAESVEREGIQALWDRFYSQGLLPGADTLAPGQEDVKYSWDITFEQILSFRDLDYQSVDLMGVTPHMHNFATAMEVDIEAPDGDFCVADVHKWDFNWQRAYFYEAPVQVGRDAQVNVTCSYDTSGRTEPVAAGLGTEDEMCLLGLYFAETE